MNSELNHRSNEIVRNGITARDDLKLSPGTGRGVELLATPIRHERAARPRQAIKFVGDGREIRSER